AGARHHRSAFAGDGPCLRAAGAGAGAGGPLVHSGGIQRDRAADRARGAGRDLGHPFEPGAAAPAGPALSRGLEGRAGRCIEFCRTHITWRYCAPAAAAPNRPQTVERRGLARQWPARDARTAAGLRRLAGPACFCLLAKPHRSDRMSKGQRKIGLAVAQMGPVHLADTRRTVVARLVEMLREAHGRGAELVVFPELALTTFFPRYWMSDAEAQARFFEAQMPNPE